MTTSGRSGKPRAGGASAAPNDAQELEREIERTREQLGETVEQLAAKADVTSRARDAAARLTRRVKDATARAREQAATRASQVCGQLTAATAPVRRATPEPVRRATAQGAGTARRHNVPLTVAVLVLIAGCLLIRHWRKR